MEENGVSKPETVKRLRNALKTFNLTVAQIIDKMKQSGCDISETTIRRFFNDEIPPETNWRDETLRAISDIIYGSNADDFDVSKARMYYDECRELRESINELRVALADKNARLDHFRELVAKEQEGCQFLREEIVFLRERLTYISPKKED